MKLNNRLLTNVLVVLLIGSSAASAQQKKEFVLNCTVSGMKEGAKAYLCIMPGVDTVARAEVKNGKFSFKGSVPNGADFYFVKLANDVNSNPSQGILLVNESMKLSSTLETWPNVELVGSEANDDFFELLKLYKAAQAKGVTGDEQNKVVLDFIRDHKNSLYVADLILQNAMLLKRSGVKEAYAQLTDRAKNCHFGLALKRMIDLPVLSEQVKLGGTLPDFKVRAIDGVPISVLEQAKKGKLTLIDFWASWCGPCEAEIPNMKKVYTAFHDKGFNIIGVSTDNDEAAWQNALGRDKTPWFHGRDILDKAWGVVFTLGSLPAYILVDGEGKLLAFSRKVSKSDAFGPEIRGAELYKTIASLLK